MNMQFFYAPTSISLAAHIVLDEAGAQYAPRLIDLALNEQRSEAYLSINPKGRVPALATDDGLLTETPAILDYLAQAYPEADLLPNGGRFARARALEFNAYLCSTVHVAHAHKNRGRRWADDEAALEAMRRHVPNSMLNACSLIEADMLKGPWVMGEQYTVCDPYLFAISRWLESDGVDINQLPRIAAHRLRMRQRPAVARLMSGTYV
jgi:glutathione S-transferase